MPSPAIAPSAPAVRSTGRDDGGAAAASRLPGLAVAVGLALRAWLAGRALPLLGGAVCGILLGVLVRSRWTPAPHHAPGIAFASRGLLQASVVVLGFGLDLGQVARTGLHSLPVTLVTLAVSFATAWWLGRALRIPARLGLLVGIGTAICGGSAIAAAAPIVRPDEYETAYAISAIFLFNLVAVLLFPLLGHALHLSDAGFGTWAGTAINDTSSVVAAGYAYSRDAGDIATVVKLTRATLIVPVCIALAALLAWRQRRAGAGNVDLRRIVPWFVLWFLVAAGARGAGLVPAAMLPWLHEIAAFAMVVALTAIGLSADLRRMAATGARPLLLGLGVWVAVAASSLLVQAVLAQT
ncbi:MAG: putative sulfate exporter family transporter [Lysobacter sp.]|nr:putative sulfate exporter family transporter [Lysobacter sp.]